MNRAVLRIAFATAAEAKVAGQALQPDHGGQVAWHLDGKVLVLDVASGTALGLVRTLDDALGCLRATGLP